MPTCAGCQTCQTPDSVYQCDACSRPGAPVTPYRLFVHQTPGRPTQWTEIRPAGGSRALVTRERRRGVRLSRVPVCPKCEGELVRR